MFQLVERYSSSNERPILSVVMPVFNQEAVITKTLDSLVETLTTPCELILIDDSSEDSSLSLMLAWTRGLSRKGIKPIKDVFVYTSKRQMFETACDNFGFSLSRGTYVLEVQADIHMTEVGFDDRMVQAMGLDPEILALSGKGTETFESAFRLMISKGGTTVSRGPTPFRHFLNTLLAPLYYTSHFLRRRALKGRSPGENIARAGMVEPFPSEQMFRLSGLAGDPAAETISQYPRDKIWLGETVMRGPLIFNRDFLDGLGGLDGNSFFLGYDDHDLCLRAAQSGLKVGYLPVGYTSEFQWGSSRKRRTLISEYSLLRERIRVSKNWRDSNTYSVVNSSKFPTVVHQVLEFEMGRRP